MGNKRLTEKPFRIGFTVTESGANVYTEAEIQLPTVALGRKVQGVELMKITSDMDQPENEAGQSNVTQAQINRDSRSALAGPQNLDNLYNRKAQIDNTQSAAGESAHGMEVSKFDDLTDGDGNGLVIAESSIYACVKGTGNATVRAFAGQIWCHLVELDAADVIIEQLVSD